MFKKLLAVFLVSFVLVSCGDSAPKIDASSKTAFQTSLRDINSTLEGKDKDDFNRAIMKVGLAASFATDGEEGSIQKILQEKLGGKTAKEIIKEYGGE
ncbi:hypothetical protein GCM10023211_05770 [Orbus sasakiae]|uniref:Uncharacterized protein n=1 Tax=Orbus sasakiae TaxID=1078475 RepID=A0ABP9N2T0_9GAMM